MTACFEPTGRVPTTLDHFISGGAVRLEHWDEDTTRFKPLLYLHASTYCVAPLFDILPSLWDDPIYVVSPAKQFAYLNHILPAGTPLRNMERPGQKGVVAWDYDICIPSLIDMHIDGKTGDRLPDLLSEKERVRRGAVWMSLTPNEMLSQRSGIRKASGKVLVGGLGLGWFLNKVCAKPEVEEVVVIEKSRELLDWYGYEQCRKQPKVNKVICDDVYNHIGKHGNAQHLLDIWPISNGARSDCRYLAAKRKWKKRLWAWGIN